MQIAVRAGFVAAALVALGGCDPNGGGGGGSTTSSGGTTQTGGSTASGGSTGGSTGGSITGGTGGSTGGAGGMITGGAGGVTMSSGGAGGATMSTSSTTATLEVICNNVYEGSFTIANDADVQTITPYCAITGDLTIALPAFSQLTLPNLLQVLGKIDQQNELSGLDLPVLQVGSQIKVSATFLKLPELTKLTGGMSEITSFGSIKLPKLKSAADLYFKPIGEVQVDVLESAGDVTVGSYNTSSTGLYMPAIVTLGALHLLNCSGLVLNNALTAVTGTLSIYTYFLPSLLFPSLASVGGMNIDSNYPVSAPKLETVGSGGLTLGHTYDASFPKLVTIDGDLVLRGTALTSLNLPELTTVGTQVWISGDNAANPCMSGQFTGNSSLATLALPKLTHVGGAANDGPLLRGSTPVLPQCRWDALVTQLQTGGWTGMVKDDPQACPLAAGPCP